MSPNSDHYGHQWSSHKTFLGTFYFDLQQSKIELKKKRTVYFIVITWSLGLSEKVSLIHMLVLLEQSGNDHLDNSPGQQTRLRRSYY